jgi:hypothetical protein
MESEIEKYGDAFERVQRGAKWLDEVAPGWEQRVNVQTLVLSSPYDCICGQIFAEEAEEAGLHGDGYTYGKTLLAEGANLSPLSAAFAHEFNETLEVRFSDLKDEWELLLKDRQF